MTFDRLKKKRVLVTGGGGFFASHLVHKLHELGAEIAIISKYNSVIDNIRLARWWDDIHCIEADLRNQDALKQVADWHPAIVFHLAAYNHVGDSFVQVQESLSVNALGTANLMEAYRGYERFIYISTSESYGHVQEVPFSEGQTPLPASPYAVGKYCGELYARMHRDVYRLPIVLLRPFNLYGPYQSPRAVIAELILKCLRGEVIRTTVGEQTRDFNYIDNIVDGVLLAATHEKILTDVVNLGSGEEIAIHQLVRKIHSLTGSRSKLDIGALPYRPTEIWRMRADNQLAKRELGWAAQVSLDEGLERTVAWYRKFLEVYSSANSPLLQL
jgi:nucleoside-diphosphate-sugar epimerase